MKCIGSVVVGVGLVAVHADCAPAGGNASCKDSRAMDSKGEAIIIT